MAAITVILPTHNPNPGRLRRVFKALALQTLSDPWELLVIDNASERALSVHDIPEELRLRTRVIREPRLGLSAARRCGFLSAASDILIMVDDDNVLCPTYLADVLRILTLHPAVGAAGGPCIPEFEVPPPAWATEFYGLLACRDLGPAARIDRPFTTGKREYPIAAPIGAGMALRKSALQPWLDQPESATLSDRRGNELTSGGDNDIVLSLLQNGWAVGYFPELVVTHLIPANRLDVNYLARLNRSMMRSWMRVLFKYRCNPWPRIPRWTLPLRNLKAWIKHQPWRDPVQRVRFAGVIGQFEGLSDR